MRGVCGWKIQRRDRLDRVHRLWIWKIFHNHSRDGGDHVSRLPGGHDFADSKHVECCVYQYRMQPRIHGPGRHMLHVRRGHIQSRHGFSRVHGLRRGDVLDYTGRDGGDGLSRVWGQFRCPDSKLNRHGLHLQRRLLWPSRRRLHDVRRGHIQSRHGFSRVHELSGLLRRGLCAVYSVDTVRLHRLHRRSMHRLRVGISAREHERQRLRVRPRRVRRVGRTVRAGHVYESSSTPHMTVPKLIADTKTGLTRK